MHFQLRQAQAVLGSTILSREREEKGTPKPMLLREGAPAHKIGQLPPLENTSDKHLCTSSHSRAFLPTTKKRHAFLKVRYMARHGGRPAHATLRPQPLADAHAI